MTFTEGSTVEHLVRDFLWIGTAYDPAVGPGYATFRSKAAEGADDA